MALEPFVTLAPLEPFKNTYDPANPNLPYVYAYVFSWGGMTLASPPFQLGNQTTNDVLMLGGDAVPPENTTIGGPFPNGIQDKCTLYFYLRGTNVSTANQYLMVSGFLRYVGQPTVQIFVGGTLVTSQQLNDNHEETVAILMDVPGDNVVVPVYIRLAGDSPSAAIGWTGTDWYLL